MKFYLFMAVMMLTTGTGMAATGSTPTSAAGLPVLGSAKFGTSRFGIDRLSGFTISAVVIGGNGSITCQSPVTLGGTCVCSIAPEGGYTLASFTDNQFDRLQAVRSNSYVIPSITADHIVTATFSSNPLPGVCGSSNDGKFSTPPNDNLCAFGTASTVTGTGPWSWTCAGLNDGATSVCSANTDFRIKMLETSTTHLTLQDAYNDATEGGTIFAQATTFTENFYCDKKIRVKLFGGKDSNYAATTGFTTIRGTMTIRDGRLDISGFILK